MSDAERVDALLDMFGVVDRESLDWLLDHDWDPLGCGCCSYTPDRLRDGQIMSDTEYEAFKEERAERDKRWREANPGMARVMDAYVEEMVSQILKGPFAFSQSEGSS